MKTTLPTDDRLLKVVVAALGVANLAAGVSLLLAPVWFYDTVASYAPYNPIPFK